MNNCYFLYRPSTCSCFQSLSSFYNVTILINIFIFLSALASIWKKSQISYRILKKIRWKNISVGKPSIYQLSTETQTLWPYETTADKHLTALAWSRISLPEDPTLLLNLTKYSNIVMPGLLLLHKFPQAISFPCMNLLHFYYWIFFHFSKKLRARRAITLFIIAKRKDKINVNIVN